MTTVTADELRQHPERLLDDACQGLSNIVTVDGEPMMLTLPLGPGSGSSVERLELAAALYDRDQLSLGLAAKVAGLGYSQMIDELGRRGIATIRLTPGELERELAGF